MTYQPGDTVFSTVLPGKSREQLALFSAGTEDPNPIHVDEDFARRAGFPTVLQQGPMTTAHFARLLEQHLGAGRLRFLDVNFTAPVFPDEDLHLTATVDSVDSLVRCTLTATKTDGTLTAKGDAAFIPEQDPEKDRP